MITDTPALDQLDAEQLRELAARLMTEMRVKQAMIDKLTHEMATLKRLKFAATSEAYAGEQQQLLSSPGAYVASGHRPDVSSSGNG